VAERVEEETLGDDGVGMCSGGSLGRCVVELEDLWIIGRVASDVEFVELGIGEDVVLPVEGFLEQIVSQKGSSFNNLSVKEI
jgi:hypothetical protein